MPSRKAAPAQLHLASARSGADDEPPLIRRPSFRESHKRRLREIGLTSQQVAWLQRDLEIVQDWITPLAKSADVRRELREFAGLLDRAAEMVAGWRRADQVGKWRAASLPDQKKRLARGEALRQFNIAAAHHVRGLGAKDLNLGDELDPAAVVEKAAELARLAVEMAPSEQRRPMRAAPEVIGIIVRNLYRPADDASQAAARRLHPSREGDFLGLAEVVWDAVGSAGSPAKALQKYMAQQTLEREGGE